MRVDLTGRRTGRHHRLPVSYVRHEDTLLTPEKATESSTS